MRAGAALLCLAALASACTTAFSGKQERHVGRALALQSAALQDDRFGEILGELDQRGEIVWTDRLLSAARQEASAYPSRGSWLLARFARDGGLSRARLEPFFHPDRDASTTAIHDPHTQIVRINLRRFYADDAALLNTFLHEQTHSWGVIHAGQRRAPNQCDPAYIVGDLAEALVRSESEPDSRSPHGAACPALCGALERRGL